MIDKFYTQSMQVMDISSHIIVCQDLVPSGVLQFESRQLLSKLKTVDFLLIFNKINTLSYAEKSNYCALLSGNRQIKPRMITKLLTWIQKLCKETLLFSTKTFETASRILVKYLSLVDQPVSSLQLLGSACIYLSSKIQQRTIVAAESISQCSCNIFNANQLMVKEAQIYKVISGKTDYPCLYDIYQYIQNRNYCQSQKQSVFVNDITDEQNNKILEYISFCVKDVEFLGWHSCQLMIAIIQTVLENEVNQDCQGTKKQIQLMRVYMRKTCCLEAK